MDYCQGHGACSDTMMCTCDQNRHGDSCVTSFQLPTHLSDDFERSDGQSPVRGQEIRGEKRLTNIVNFYLRLVFLPFLQY